MHMCIVSTVTIAITVDILILTDFWGSFPYLIYPLLQISYLLYAHVK